MVKWLQSAADASRRTSPLLWGPTQLSCCGLAQFTIILQSIDHLKLWCALRFAALWAGHSWNCNIYRLKNHHLDLDKYLDFMIYSNLQIKTNAQFYFLQRILFHSIIAVEIRNAIYSLLLHEHRIFTHIFCKNHTDSQQSFWNKSMLHFNGQSFEQEMEFLWNFVEL